MENKKIVDYTVIFGSDALSLSNSVLEKLKEGFVPQGGLSRSYACDETFKYAQALVKYEV